MLNNLCYIISFLELLNGSFGHYSYLALSLSVKEPTEHWCMYKGSDINYTKQTSAWAIVFSGWEEDKQHSLLKAFA